MPLAAIYARVSSPQQRVEQTIVSQTEAVRAQAEALGFEVPKEWVFEDEGVSGATLERPHPYVLLGTVAQNTHEGPSPARSEDQSPSSDLHRAQSQRLLASGEVLGNTDRDDEQMA